jgi:MOSC domain-containing protein YiiM
MRSGRVAWIGLRPERRNPVTPVQSAELIAGQGLAGDHYKTARDGPRQITLIQREDLEAIASFLGVARVDPGALRRNVMVEGINLLALKDRRIKLGEAELAWTGECDPCGRMDETLGPGGYNAVRRHGGITARVTKGGTVRVGDIVERLLD